MAAVPEVESLGLVYQSREGDEAPRYTRLQHAFQQTFGQAPELFARAPGRVNLIGEHIDYEGYAVLPMAIDQDTVVAIRRGGEKLVIANLYPDKYPTVEFDTDPRQSVDVDRHTWANYFMCAYKGVFEYLEAHDLPVPTPEGLQVTVHGIVPTGAGVSSSAAIVCSCSLAILGVYGIQVSQAEVANFTAKAEQYVGVTSGGMDQAASIMGKSGVAMLVEFNPVRTTDIHIPEGATFVVANSLAVSNKAESAPRRYNMRVIECRLAAAVMAVKLGHPVEAAVQVRTLLEVEPLIAAAYGEGADAKVAAVSSTLHEGPYPQEEVEQLLGASLDVLYAGQDTAKKVLAAAKELGGFKLRNRALHVYSEAARVLAFQSVCEGPGSRGEKMRQLGGLMNDSHGSCSQLYECSCEELEELVGIARASGALGSRLTGAGWGGCTVSLVEEEKVGAFMEALKREFFQKRISRGLITERDIPNVLFASKPASGSAILRLKW